MIWALLARLLSGALLAWFAGLVAVLLVRMVRGEIVTSGLFAGRAGETLDFHRLQMVAVTGLFLAVYIVRALRLPPGSGLPDIDSAILTVIIGSQSVYLLGKYRQS